MSEREFPNSWPENGCFAYSGLDGATRYDEPFVASGMARRVGWRFELSPSPLVVPFLDGRRMQPQQADRDYVFADAWRVTVLSHEYKGLILGAFLDHDSIAIRCAFKGLPTGIAPELLVNLDTVTSGKGRLVVGDGWWLAMIDAEAASDRRFGLGLSYRSAGKAMERAEAALDCDLNSLIEERLEPYADRRYPESLSGNPKRTYGRAVSVMRAHVHSPQGGRISPWMAPERNPKRHRWLWETAILSLGWIGVRIELAEAVFASVFDQQRASGKLSAMGVPGAAPSENEEAHLPLFAWAAWEIYSATGRGQSLERWYPKLTAYLGWYDAHRALADGLYGWRPIGASGAGVDAGMHASPRFNGSGAAVAAADLSAAMAAEFYYMARIAEALNRTDERAEWQRRHKALAAAMNERLWDDQDRFYYDAVEDGDFVFSKYAASLLALLGRVPDRDQAEALRVHLMQSTEFYPYVPAASLSCDEEGFGLYGWAGPVWPLLNVPLCAGLKAYGFVEEASTVASATQREIERWYKHHGVFYPSYDPQGNQAPDAIVEATRERVAGVPIPEPDFAPTAAAYLYFHHCPL